MPLLVQFGDLTMEHFADDPVWVACDSVDHDEPWYAETDAETFRPWGGPLPVDPIDATYLVRADFTFRDGERLPGFVSPVMPDAPSDLMLGALQPHVFVPTGECVALWLGMVGDAAAAARMLYASTARSAREIFPIAVSARAGLARGSCSAVLTGFYTIDDSLAVRVSC
jgi:hypothetical protein